MHISQNIFGQCIENLEGAKRLNDRDVQLSRCSSDFKGGRLENSIS